MVLIFIGIKDIIEIKKVQKKFLIHMRRTFMQELDFEVVVYALVLGEFCHNIILKCCNYKDLYYTKCHFYLDLLVLVSFVGLFYSFDKNPFNFEEILLENLLFAFRFAVLCVRFFQNIHKFIYLSKVCSSCKDLNIDSRSYDESTLNEEETMVFIKSN